MSKLYLLLFSTGNGSEEYVVFTEDPKRKWKDHQKPGFTLDAAFDITEAEPIRSTACRAHRHFTSGILPLDQPMTKES